MADSVEISHVFDEAGDPYVYANTVPNGSKAGYSWSVCRPDESCVPASQEQFFIAGPQPAGTTFRVEGEAGSAVSKPWLGRVSIVDPPTLTGEPKVGSQVLPERGNWSGGWGGENDFFQVQACDTPAAESCVTIYAQGCGPSNTQGIVKREHVGTYLFAVDRRHAREQPVNGPACGSPEFAPPEKAGPLVAFSAPLGPVTDPQPTTPEPSPPALRLRARTRRYFGRLTCGSCEVRVTIRRGKRRWQFTRKVTGELRLELPKGARKPGWVRVTVDVDGRRIAADDVRVLR